MMLVPDRPQPADALLRFEQWEVLDRATGMTWPTARIPADCLWGGVAGGDSLEVRAVADGLLRAIQSHQRFALWQELIS